MSKLNESMVAQNLLKQIRQKGTVQREDLQKILKLDEESQSYIINRISQRRQNILMKHLNQLPTNEDFAFDISRKQSLANESKTSEQPTSSVLDPPEIDFDESDSDFEFKRPASKSMTKSSSLPLQARAGKAPLQWLQDLKSQHKKFNFSKEIPKEKPQSTSTPKEKDVEPLYKNEKDPISQMIQRILYAEGDYIHQQPESVNYLKQTLIKIVNMFQIEQPKIGQKRSKNDSKEKQSKRQKIDENSEVSSDRSYIDSKVSESDDNEIYHSSNDSDKIQNEISDSSDLSENKTSKTKIIDESDFIEIDYSMLFYVFEFVIQRYFRLKKSAKEGQQVLSLENKQEKPREIEEITQENMGKDEIQVNKVDIVGIEDIKKRFEWYQSLGQWQEKPKKTKNYNELSLKEALARMREESSSQEDSEEVVSLQAVNIENEDTVGLKINSPTKVCAQRQLLQIFQKDCKSQIETLKNEFQVWRVEEMNLKEYAQFQKCRQQNFLSRGKAVFQKYVKIKSEKSKKGKGLKQGNLDTLAFILRHILKLVVEISISQTQNQNPFAIRKEPISKKIYQKSMGLIVDEIKLKMHNYISNLQALQMYAKEMQKLRTPSHNDLQFAQSVHLSWKNLSLHEKCDFVCRFNAEKSILKFQQSSQNTTKWNTEELKNNYYAIFLKKSINKIKETCTKKKVKFPTLTKKTLQAIFIDGWKKEVYQKQV